MRSSAHPLTSFLYYPVRRGAFLVPFFVTDQLGRSTRDSTEGILLSVLQTLSLW